MRNYSRITPEGTKDILFKECRLRREVEHRLEKLFHSRGYNEVLTSGLEYFDVFCLPGATIPQQEMYKTTDNNGRLIVFRPDSTLPIARMAAARLQNAAHPIRLFYNQSVYRNRPDLSGRSNEIAQMGIELLGAGGLRADLEVLTMAIEAASAFTENFRIEIGHAAIFKTLAGKLAVTQAQREEIRETIESKNYAALDGLLDRLEQTEAVKAVRSLPRLFGGAEALEAAEKYCTDETSNAMLGYLKQLYETAICLGYEDRVIVDLGLVQRNDYYTGVIFSAYAEDFGDAVLVGGRYDNLLEKFDSPMPAIGFSIDTDAVTEMLYGAAESAAEKHVLLHYEPGYEAKGQQQLHQRIARGEISENSVFETLEDSLDYARQLGIPFVVYVGEEILEIPVEGIR